MPEELKHTAETDNTPENSFKSSVGSDFINRLEKDTLFNQMFISNPAIMLLVQPDTLKIVYANNAAIKFYGYTFKKFINELSIFDLNTSPPEVIKKESTAVFTGKKNYFNFNHKTSSGEIKYVELYSSKIEVLGNAFLYSIIQDNTERVNSAEKLRDSEIRYHDLIETAQDLIWQCDSEGRYVFLNKAWEKVLGYKTDEMLGKKFTDFQSKEQAARDKIQFKKLLKGGTLEGLETIHFDNKGREVYLIFNAKFVVDDNKKVIGTRGSAYDITSRKKVEEQLRASEEKYRSIYKASPFELHSYELMADGRLIFTSANSTADKFMGIKHNLLFGKSIEQAFPNLAETEIPEMYKNIAKGKLNTQCFELPYEDSYIKGFYEVKVFRTGKNSIAVSFNDITERKKSEQELNKLNRLYAVISQVNQTIVRTTEKNKLLTELCEVVIKFGKFPLVWIGIADGTNKYLDNSYSSGDNTDYLSNIKIRLNGTTSNYDHPSKTSFKNNKISICNNLANIPGKSKWKTEALKRNYNSLISIPVSEDDKLIGNINIFTTEINFFQKAEISLFKEIADDISYSLTTIAKENIRRKYEEALKESEEIFTLFMKHSPIYMFFKDKDIRAIRLSQNYETMIGMPVEKMIGKTMDELFPSELSKKMVRDDKKILNEKRILEVEEKFNDRFYYTIKFPILIDGEARYLAGFTMDITDRKLAAKKLEENEARFETLAESSFEGIVISVGGKVLDCNRQLEQMFGYQHSEMIGKSITTFVAPESVEDVKKHILSEEKEPYEHLAIKKDKSLFQVEIRARVVNYEGKKVRITSIRDITERFKMEEALRESERKFRSVIEYAAVGICLVGTDGKFLQVNKTFCELLGYNEQEFQELTFNDITFEDDKEAGSNLVAQMLSGKLNNFNFEKRYVHKNGKIIWGIVSVALLRDKKNKPQYFVTHIRDITKRKLTEQAYKESENKFRSLVQSMNEGLALHKAIRNNRKRIVDYLIVDVNKAYEKQTGLSAKKVKNQIASEFYGVTPPPFLGIYSKVIETGKPAHFEVYFEPLKKYFEISAFAPMPDTFATVFSDITEKKKHIKEIVEAKEHAEAMNKAKSVFLATMSHELRTPLVGILGYSELLSQDIEDPLCVEMAEGINRTGKRLLNTLSLVLDLSRVESDKFEVNFSESDIIEILDEIVKDFEGAVSIKQIDLVFEKPKKPVILTTDKSMVKIIIENLINNAIKFTEKGEIRISTKFRSISRKKYFCVSVSDTGIGIKKKDLDLIFEEFRQVSEGTTREFPGTGLGLAITKKYTQILGGKIYVESKHGKGTIFSICLPM